MKHLEGISSKLPQLGALLGSSPHSWRQFSSRKSLKPERLFQRISPIGDPSASVVPILDQWVLDGNLIDQPQLQHIIQELRFYRRFNHALQVSQWMSDKLYLRLSAKDIAARLDLISRVHGQDKVENYFDNIPRKLKRFEVYLSLLNCYAREKSIDKAEAMMQQIRGKWKLNNPACYNILMNLYYQTEKHERIDSLVSEMEKEGVAFDAFTFGIRLSAYASTSDIDGMNKIMEKVESSAGLDLNWNFYSIAADGYIKVGLVDNAAEMLKKLEEQLPTSKRKKLALDSLLYLYARIGRRDKLYDLWDLYKKERIFNKGYMRLITSFLMVDDVKGAVKIYKKWKSSSLTYDSSIPNLLVSAYCRKGLPSKAEELVGEVIACRGVQSQVELWISLAGGCIENDQFGTAVEALKKAILTCPPRWEPGKECLSECLDYLEGKGDIEGAEKFAMFLRAQGVFSTVAHERLLNYVKADKSLST